MEKEVSLYRCSSPDLPLSHVAASCLNPKVCFHRCSDAPFSNPPIHLPQPPIGKLKLTGGRGGTAQPNRTRLA